MSWHALSTKICKLSPHLSTSSSALLTPVVDLPKTIAVIGTKKRTSKVHSGYNSLTSWRTRSTLASNDYRRSECMTWKKEKNKETGVLQNEHHQAEASTALPHEGPEHANVRGHGDSKHVKENQKSSPPPPGRSLWSVSYTFKASGLAGIYLNDCHTAELHLNPDPKDICHIRSPRPTLPIFSIYCNSYHTDALDTFPNLRNTKIGLPPYLLSRGLGPSPSRPAPPVYWKTLHVHVSHEILSCSGPHSAGTRIRGGGGDEDGTALNSSLLSSVSRIFFLIFVGFPDIREIQQNTADYFKFCKHSFPSAPSPVVPKEHGGRKEEQALLRH